MDSIKRYFREEVGRKMSEQELNSYLTGKFPNLYSFCEYVQQIEEKNINMKKLNFGCGADLKHRWDNVDMQKGEKIKINFDFDKFPYPLPKNNYEYVLLNQVIEHLIYPEKTLQELHSACRNGAIIRIETPHYTNKGAYNSLQHRGFFNEKAFTNFVNSTTLLQKNPYFKLKSLNITPTKIGKIIPNFLRKKLSLFINGLYSQIHVEYEVLK